MIQVDVKNSFNGYARQYGLRKTSEIMLPGGWRVGFLICSTYSIRRVVSDSFSPKRKVSESEERLKLK